MFGERPQTQVQDDPASIRAQIRRAMVETSDLSGRHLDVVTRICMLLQQKIDEAADTIVKKTENLGPVGFLTDAEAIGMESCITNMRIMTRVFQSDVNAGEPGAFFEVVAANLRRGDRISICFTVTVNIGAQRLRLSAGWSPRAGCRSSCLRRTCSCHRRWYVGLPLHRA